VLSQSILSLKARLPENGRLLDKLITYLQVREIFLTAKPLEFAEKSNIIPITKESLVPDSQGNVGAALNRVGQRLSALRM
jgi:hypothetical protein